ncbi:nucleoside phosphorylase domain-containing protein [Corynascus novoguineensis]|uniref:Nucleoside phosphorylase domain-containing protein n=1 Tax=Corynascus novoguineensis TaxID=1126955 RepID=A0AAN7CWN9_9PEZI|nr:nucleoside phosphorylase domain-containing protein [Corynascus novoguineensis]
MARDQELYDTVEVAWICILPCEFDAAKAMLDERYDDVTSKTGEKYVLGRMGHHNVVIGFLPAGSMGKAPTVRVAVKIQLEFRNIRFCLLVGVAGGCPDPDDSAKDIRLGDVVVSEPKGNRGGVVQVDAGKKTHDGFMIFSHLNKVNEELLFAIQLLKSEHRGRSRKMDEYIDEAMAKSRDHPELAYFKRPKPETDRLFQIDYPHPSHAPDCRTCSNDHTRERQPRKEVRGQREERPRVFYGTIGSGDHVLRSARERERLSREIGILCVEMEAAGVLDTLPSLVVRGICDYADSHKNKEWQPYAALAAAAYAKDLLTYAQKAAPAKVHGTHCTLGTIQLDEVQRAFAANPLAFREDLKKLGEAMSDTSLHFSNQRLPLFHDFLRKHGLPHTSHWVSMAHRNQLFDGYSADSARATRDDRQRDPRERLAAARAFAFICANRDSFATTYLVQDTVLRMWNYVESR